MTNASDVDQQSLLDVFDPSRQSRHYAAAATISAALIVVAGVAFQLNAVRMPASPAFIPIVATIWIVFEALTAFLLLSQFLVTGFVPFAVFGGLFGFTSLVTIPYLAFFPSVFGAAPLLGLQQTSAWLWLAWHLAFAAVAVAYVIRDPSLRLRCESVAAVARVLRWTVAIVVVAACVIVGSATLEPHVPILVSGGHFSRTFIVPARCIAILSGAAWLAVILTQHRRTIFGLWLGVSILGEGLDAWLNSFAAERYTAGWYVGKLETTVTATAIFVVLLFEIVLLYRKVTTQRREAIRLTEMLQHDIRSRRSTEQALKESDELFRRVEEHTPIGMSIVAVDGTLLRVNPALCALTGYENAELVTMNREALTHPDDRSSTAEHLRQLLDGVTTSFEQEKRYLHKDGRIVWAQLTCTVVRDETDRPLYVIAQVQEIGARKAAERAVREAEQCALAATRAKSRFLASMSHEIRTPMNGIVGMTELLSLSTLSREQTEYVAAVLDSGRSLMQLLNDILDYSKVEAGKYDLDCVDFSFEQQIASVTSLLSPQFRAKGVSFSTTIAPNVAATVKGDPCRVRQILVNLIGNALKFTPAGGSVDVRVTVEPGGEPNFVRFSVRDTGIGIAPEARHRLFQPFSQVDDSTTRSYGGTGLGLSICKQLVDLMGGAIGFESDRDAGSRFWFSVRFQEADRPARAPARDDPPAGDRRTSRSERILLAEDNAINALLAKRQFERLGFELTVVPNGREAVEALQSSAFDIVFMDCQMPTMDGFEATRAIRATAAGRERTPIVAMTANALAEDRVACLQAGMDDYVSKPVSLSTLQDVIDRWLPDASHDRSTS